MSLVPVLRQIGNLYVCSVLIKDIANSKYRSQPRQRISPIYLLLLIFTPSSIYNKDDFVLISSNSSANHISSLFHFLEMWSETLGNVFRWKGVNPIVLITDSRVKNSSSDQTTIVLQHLLPSAKLYFAWKHLRVALLTKLHYLFCLKPCFIILLRNLFQISTSSDMFIMPLQRFLLLSSPGRNEWSLSGIIFDGVVCFSWKFFHALKPFFFRNRLSLLLSNQQFLTRQMHNVFVWAVIFETIK